MDDHPDSTPSRDTGTPADRIGALLDAVRADTDAALRRLAERRDRAAAARATLDTETRAYAAEWRAIAARGWLSAAQLRDAGFPAPRTRTRRAKPNSG